MTISPQFRYICSWLASLVLSTFMLSGMTSTAVAQEYGPGLVKKAEAGDAESQFQLSRCYSLGKGVAEDQLESMKWEVKAAEQGHSGAQLNLGARLQAGLGVPKDPVQAAKWLNLALAAGHPRAAFALKWVEGEMKPEQITEAKKLAAAWKANAPGQIAGSSPGRMQTWVSTDGRSITAEWVRLDGESVVLKRADGQVFQVPLNRLSPESQAAAKQPTGK